MEVLTEADGICGVFQILIELVEWKEGCCYRMVVMEKDEEMALFFETRRRGVVDDDGLHALDEIDGMVYYCGNSV